MTTIRRIDGPDVFREQFGVSRETTEKLEAYAALLKQWQKAVQLVAPSTLDDIWHRHFADSAQLLAHGPAGALRWLDVGAGAGFPGLVAAILNAATPGFRAILVESDSRKAAFLGEVARKTGAPVDILCARIEMPSTHTKVGSVDVVAARALAPLDKLLDLVVQYRGSETVGLFLKGRDADAEVLQARRRWTFELKLEPSLTDPEGRIIIVRNWSAIPEG